MAIGDSIIRELRKMREYACELVETNPICPTFEGIAYQDIPHFQTTVYRTGDEGYRVVNGLMDQNNPAFPAYTQRLGWNSADPFNTLFYDNIFGTRDRFTDINGLQVYGDGIIVDHLSKRMYNVITNSAINWEDTVDLVETSVVGGFSDWHLASREEILNVYNNTSTLFTIVGISVNNAMWTSTTVRDATTRANDLTLAVSAATSVIRQSVKTQTKTNPLSVRIFDESDLNI